MNEAIKSNIEKLQKKIIFTNESILNVNFHLKGISNIFWQSPKLS